MAAGCDVGDPLVDAPPKAPLQVLATYPRDGQGTECAPDSAADCGLPINTTIELRLNRYLDPATAVRQAVKVYTGHPDDNRFLDLEPHYDIVERVLWFGLRESTNPDEPLRFEPRTLYTVEIIQANAETGDGLRAFDGTALEPGPVPLRFSFLTGETELAPPAASKPPTCGEIVEMFGVSNAGCSGSDCHRDATARMGLDLSAPGALLATAIDRVSHGSNVGPSSGGFDVNPSRFGVNMALIQRNAPERSYLLYKLLRDPLNFRLSVAADDPCELESRPTYDVALPEDGCLAPSADERERLREWFVRGEAMPRREPKPGQEQGPLGFNRDQLRDLAAWIRDGAICP